MSSYGFHDICKFLIMNGEDVNQQDAFSILTPLHMACQNKRFKVASLLIEHGAKVNSKDRTKIWLFILIRF